MKDSIYVSKENYLKAILEAEAEGRQVIPAMLAHWLEVSAPAVTMALKRLKRDGFVQVGEDGIVRLTTAGRNTAYSLFCAKHQFTCSCENSVTTLAGTSASFTSLNSKVMLPSGATVASRYP